MNATQETLARELVADDPSALVGEEVRLRMEVAFADCVRRSLPVSVLFVEVTRLDPRMLRFDVRPAAVRQAIADVLRRKARGGDLYACEHGTGILVLLPNTEHELAGLIGREAIDEAKRLTIAGLPRPVRVGLGIGLARSPGHGELLFETLVLVACEGAAVAKHRGGECCVHTMLYEVMQRRAREQALASGKSASAPRPEVEHARPEDRGRRTIPEPRVSSPAEPAQALREENERAESRSLPAENEVEILRRRIAKLNRALEASERNLKEVSALKGIDPGIASDYREVQGLSPTAHDHERKQTILGRIFAANLELQQLRRARKHASRGSDRLAAGDLAPASRAPRRVVDSATPA